MRLNRRAPARVFLAQLKAHAIEFRYQREKPVIIYLAEKSRCNLPANESIPAVWKSIMSTIKPLILLKNNYVKCCCSKMA